jgi:predicted regulator of Ras-like GTPase activity (Roadblock/LC7/MglB family)
MKETLEELKGSMGGIIGSYVIGEGGKVLSQDVPEPIGENLDKVSLTLYHGTKVIKESNPIEKLTIDFESAKLISVDMDGRILVVIAEKNLNLAVFKLFSRMVISKLKEIPSDEVKPSVKKEEKVVEDEVPAQDSTVDPDYYIKPVCNFYDSLFSSASSKLLFLLGPGASKIFNKKLELIPKKHKKIFTNIEFGGDGKLNLTQLKENARQVSQDELITGLEYALLGMVDAVNETSGEKMRDKVLDEINKIKDQNKGKKWFKEVNIS